MRISVVGGGSWGTAFASHLAGAGHDVDLLARDAEHAAEIEATRENRQYLPGVRIADGLRVGPLAAGIAPDAGLVVLAVPSRPSARCWGARGARVGRRAVADQGPRSRHRPAAVGGGGRAAGRRGRGWRCCRGRTTPRRSRAARRRRPSSRRSRSASPQRLQETIATSRLRVYANADVVGVELCGAAKNVIALAAGVSDGLGFGDNAKAALITRGLAEMTRLGASFDADPRTFAGLAGLGDLVATCCSSLSRNRRAGAAAGRGRRGRRRRGAASAWSRRA